MQIGAACQKAAIEMRDIVKTCVSVSFRRPPIRRFQAPLSMVRV
jgi:hypothetical protein